MDSYKHGFGDEPQQEQVVHGMSEQAAEPSMPRELIKEQLGRGHRVKEQSVCLRAYVCHTVTAFRPHLLLPHQKVSSEPRTNKQAVQDPKWIEATAKEVAALQLTKTWTLQRHYNKKQAFCDRIKCLRLPPGKKTIDCKCQLQP